MNVTRRLTRNRMGWTAEKLNAVGEAFAAFCRERPGARVADIGAGFGASSLAALEAGAEVAAIDLDASHLEELRRRAGANARLETRAARFPEGVEFGAASLDAVHASSVLHFLRGRELDRGLRAAARWLRPGGKLFVHAASPYQAPFAAFLPEYAARLERGDEWPGWVAKISDYSTHRMLGQMPRSVHLLDDGVLARAAERAGLIVERAWMYRRSDLPRSLWLDGRESVGLIASQRADTVAAEDGGVL